jgi:fructan beta-fructosidase
MVLYVNEGGRGANFYTSTDLLHWEFRSRFTADWMFECPDMFQLPVDGTTFTPTSPVGRMDHGGGRVESPFYASQTFTGDPAGRVVQTAW